MTSTLTYDDMKRMTFWSRYDPVSQPKGNTDHWTKMKQRVGPTSQLGFGTVIHGSWPANQYFAKESFRPHSQQAVQFRSLDNPASIGKPITLDALQGNLPGSYMYTRPRNSVSRERLRSAYNERAKEGFRYWLIERPKPTSFGKYGIGSYKTVLGVGNAPRT